MLAEQQQDLFIGLAQLAAVLIGFLAILVVFVREDGRLAPADALRGRSILYNANSVLVGAMVPIVLAANGVEGAQVWRFSGMVMIALSVVPFVEGARFNLRMSIEERRLIGLPTAIISWGGSALTMGLMVVVAIGWTGMGVYVTAAGLGLSIASYNFVTMAVQRWL
jgi:hypothetical protein